MNGYDGLAWFYNKYWTREAPDIFERVLDRIFLSEMPARGEILDLCCGTGQVAARLSQRKYKVTGLDNSESMLSFARINAPDADFTIGDARYFKFDKQFDGVMSLFDSLNHMLTSEDLLDCFKSVRSVLKKGGMFVFDLNDEETFDEGWELGFSAVEDDNVCIMKPSYDQSTGRVKYDITTFFMMAGIWIRNDVSVYEQCYYSEDVVNLLYEANFKNIQILNGSRDLSFEAFRGRLFFIAS